MPDRIIKEAGGLILEEDDDAILLELQPGERQAFDWWAPYYGKLANLTKIKKKYIEQVAEEDELMTIFAIYQSIN